MVNAQPNCQNCQDIEKDDPEECSLDRARDGFVRCGGFTSSNGNQLDTAEGVEGVDKCLSESREASDEGLVVVEVGETL